MVYVIELYCAGFLDVERTLKKRKKLADKPGFVCVFKAHDSHSSRRTITRALKLSTRQ